jgi:hypothetical protein
MKSNRLVAFAALALAGSAALADEAPGAPLTRTQIAQSVLAARAAGTLAPAGDAYDALPARSAASTPSQLTRAQANAQVLQARAAGGLAHAGSVAPEEEMAYARANPSTSILTRAQVKADVLQARAHDQLVPAGEAEYSAMAPIESTTRTAAAPSQSVAHSGAR